MTFFTVMEPAPEGSLPTRHVPQGGGTAAGAQDSDPQIVRAEAGDRG